MDTINKFVQERQSMISWQRFTWSITLSLFAFLCMTSSAFAQTPITDDNGVNGFELYQNGLYWWSAAGVCGTEFPHDATIRLRNTLGTSTKNLVKDCTALRRAADNAVRDDTYAYFFQAGQLSRKALNATEQDAAQALILAPVLAGNQSGSNLVVAEGNLYWAVFNAQNNNSTLLRMPADGSQAPTTVTTAVRQINQLAWQRYTDANSQPQQALVWITDDARLFRYRIGSLGVPQELASTVADFALHTRLALGGSTTSIYAAMGATNVDANTAPGKVLQINIDTLLCTETLWETVSPTSSASLAFNYRCWWFISQASTWPSAGVPRHRRWPIAP